MLLGLCILVSIIFCKTKFFIKGLLFPSCMDERVLRRFAFVVVIVGLLGLYFFSQNLSPSISRIDELPDSGSVTLVGRVSRVTQTDKVAFLVVDQQKMERVDVVLFKDRNISIAPGELVEIHGSIEDDKIIGNKVILLEE